MNGMHGFVLDEVAVARGQTRLLDGISAHIPAGGCTAVGPQDLVLVVGFVPVTVSPGATNCRLGSDRLSEDDWVRIRIVGTQLPGRECAPGGGFPGYSNVHVGVQRKNRREELLDLHPGDADMAEWTLDCVVDGTDVRGPYIQGPAGGRFIYLSWGTVDDAGRFTLFRRAKLMLEDVPGDVLHSAAGSGLLVGCLGLTDAKGNPVCARVRPPQIGWSAE
jgi:hypothetical protein